MSSEFPQWLTALSEEDIQFLKRFLLASGSLKAIAKEYDISYPTVRARLDRLIAKARAADDPAPSDPLERLVKVLVAEGMLSPAVARALLTAHAAPVEERTE
jgi:hypothetical protein